MHGAWKMCRHSRILVSSSPRSSRHTTHLSASAFVGWAAASAPSPFPFSSFVGRAARGASVAALLFAVPAGSCWRPFAAAAELSCFRLALGCPGAVDQVVALAPCVFPSAGPSSGGAAAWAPCLSPPSLASGGKGGAVLAGGPVAGPRFSSRFVSSSVFSSSASSLDCSSPVSPSARVLGGAPAGASAGAAFGGPSLLITLV